MPDSNHSDEPPMAPHGVYPTDEVDRWVAIACRSDDDWTAFGTVCTEAWTADASYATVAGRVAGQAELDARVAAWTSTRNRYEIAASLRAAGVPAGVVAMSEDRIDHDPDTAAWGLFPVVHHAAIGEVRVDGVPVHLSATDWRVERGAPQLGEHNRAVFCDLLGVTDDEFAALEESGVL